MTGFFAMFLAFFGGHHITANDGLPSGGTAPKVPTCTQVPPKGVNPFTWSCK